MNNRSPRLTWLFLIGLLLVVLAFGFVLSGAPQDVGNGPVSAQQAEDTPPPDDWVEVDETPDPSATLEPWEGSE